MSREELFKNVENWTVGLDETFQFRCTQCGKCCVDREDILLNARDMYMISKHLGKQTFEVFSEYCETYIGQSSHIPILRLRPIGKTMRCPFLKDRKCIVHEAKPSVCALYPLGRYMKFDKGSNEAISDGEAKVRYLLQPISCGDTNETHTVREWLSGFDFSLEDRAYILWNEALTCISTGLKKAEKVVPEERMEPIWKSVFILLYLNYLTTEEFIPQLERNLAKAKELMKIFDVVELDEDDEG